MLMRTWSGFESSGGVYDHTIRSLSDRDFEIFRRMKPGDQYPAAHQIAVEIFEEELRKLGGNRPKDGSSAYDDLRSSKVPS
jgi:DNA (cytosine-5)-methyltransferase 1